MTGPIPFIAMKGECTTTSMKDLRQIEVKWTSLGTIDAGLIVGKPTRRNKEETGNLLLYKLFLKFEILRKGGGCLHEPPFPNTPVTPSKNCHFNNKGTLPPASLP